MESLTRLKDNVQSNEQKNKTLLSAVVESSEIHYNILLFKAVSGLTFENLQR